MNRSKPHTLHKNSKYIRDLNVKQTIKLVKNNTGKYLQNIGFGKEFLNMTPIHEKKNPSQSEFTKIKNT